MSFSVRIFLGLFLVTGLAVYLIYSSFVRQLQPGFRQSAEDTLVETANLLAELSAPEVIAENIGNGKFAEAVRAFQQRRLNATIWSLQKHRSNVQV